MKNDYQNKASNKKATIIETIIVLYTILFLYTGISKLMDYSTFKEQIATSPILEPISKPIAIILPWMEFAIVALLIVPRWRLKGLYSSLVIMTVFTIYIIAILLFNQNIPCSCGGVLEQLSWGQHIIFNSVFMTIAIIGIVLEKQRKRINTLQWSSIA
jgi:uncharacterized membrane protein YphA (DoxX/SURF4 family)